MKMVNYTVTIEGIKNEMVVQAETFWNYTSETINIQPTTKLIKEIISFYANKFNDCDSIVVRSIMASHLAIHNHFKQNIPNDLIETVKQSESNWKNAEKEVDKLMLFSTFNNVIESINQCRDKTEELKLLDSQEYLNFLDEINRLSIDQDRPNTIKPSTN